MRNLCLLTFIRISSNNAVGRRQLEVFAFYKLCKAVRRSLLSYSPSASLISPREEANRMFLRFSSAIKPSAAA